MFTIKSEKIIKKSKIFFVTIIMMSFVLQLTSFAAAYDLFKGGFASGNIVVQYMEGSESLCDSAYKKWNGISSKVTLTKGYYTKGIRTSFNKINAPNAGNLGVTYFSKGGTQVDTSSSWDDALCIQYINSSLDTNEKRLKTCVHEIGHALSLAHPASNVSSIMNQGVSTNSTIQSYDKNALKSKWGN